MMNIFQGIAIIALGILGTSMTNGEVGQICQSQFDCRPGGEFCSDGICSCKNLIYSEDSVPSCEDIYTEGLCLNTLECLYLENSECISYRCRCNEGYRRFYDSCRKVKVQGLMMSCGNIVGEETEICDSSKNIICQSKICVCSIGFIPNPLGQCEPKSSYIVRNNLTEYRVKPGLYCRKNDECLDGLECKDLKCSCPSECVYESKREVCDCGEVDEGMAHIFIGIFLGILIMIFWYKIIKLTIETQKNLRTFRAVPVDLSEPPSYSLSPMKDETTANASPSSVKQENSPHPPTFNESLHPQPHLPYPTNPTAENPQTTSELGPPPPYSLFPPAINAIPLPPSIVFPPYEKQPAYNPYYQESSNTGSADSESKLNKQD